MKLGQTLIDNGLIDSKQLKQALDAQLIYGGHLGTCMIELGLLSEAQLGPVLATSFGVPYAAPPLFQEIQRYVIAALPAALAERHSAIPLALEDKTLDVALLDPRDLQALDELSFASGHRVKPWVAPEARIFQALERYYGVPRRTRYVSLCNRLDRDDESAFDLERLDRDLPVASGVGVPWFTSSPSGRVADSPSFNPGGAGVVIAPGIEHVEPEQPGTLEDPLVDLAERMCRAEHRDQLARAVLAWSGRDLQRRVLFKLARGQARVWSAVGGELDSGQLEHVALDLMGDRTFALMRGTGAFCGPLDRGDDHAGFFAALGMRPASDALLVPIHLDDRLVAVLYGDAGPDDALDVDPALYVRVARKIAIGLNIDLLRARMRTV